MIEQSHITKVNHSDKLIEIIQLASKNMSFDEYSQATGVEKEYIFRILKGEIETVDENTLRKLSLKH